MHGNAGAAEEPEAADGSEEEEAEKCVPFGVDGGERRGREERKSGG